MSKGKRYNKKNRKKLKILILLTICIISIIILVITIILKNKNEKDNKELKDILKENYTSDKIEQLEKLQKINPDIVALIQIDGTNINYPVLQGEDNSFYMTHNYKKEYSKDGSLFLDKNYDWNLPSSNLLIYGHNNIGSTEMFASLVNYKEENYYKEHKKIRFTTNKEEAEYEIISVFLSRVYYKSEKDVFRYYYFINAENEKEFNDYVQNSKKASIYNIDLTAEYGDQLLTLSTCEYSQKDGRLAVVAKKMEK